MKKIALLFTILGVGALSAMEVPKTTEILGKGMPADVKRIVVSLVSNYRNVADAVKAIEALSITNKQLSNLINAKYGGFYDLQGFTALVHFLANNYDKTTKTVAQLFEAPIAKTYVNLGDGLMNAIPDMHHYDDDTTDRPNGFIKNGADVNYSRSSLKNPTPLSWAIYLNLPETVTLLMNAGAKLQSDEYYDTVHAWPHYDDQKAAIKKFLDEIRNREQK